MRITRRRGAAAALAGLLLAASGQALTQAAPDPAALPPQPGVAAAACTPDVGAPNSWTEVGAPTPVLSDNDGVGVRPYRLVMDPWKPCLGYRVAGDLRKLERTTDGGVSWRVVFFDDRVSDLGAQFRITGIAVPAPGVVYVIEAGNGVAVVRSRDAGATWSPANNGVAGQPLQKIVFAPSSPDVAYAVSTQGDATGYGRVAAFFATTDGGSSWRRLSLGYPPYDGVPSIAVDPGDAGHAFFSVPGFPGPTSPQGLGQGAIVRTRDYGASFEPPEKLTGGVTELLAARRPSGGLRLYWLSNSAPKGIRFRDDGQAEWRDASLESNVAWYGGFVDPTNGDRALYFGNPNYEAPSAILALFTRDGFETQEYGQQPAVRAFNIYGSGPFGEAVDRLGHFYVSIGVRCEFTGCRPEGDPHTGADGLWHEWRTFRFRPPNFGQAQLVTPGNEAACGDECRGTFARHGDGCPAIEPQPPVYPRLSEGADDSGTLAFDGTRLYYTVRGETGPDPLSAVVRIADPVTCKETGRLVVRFDHAVYADARRRAVSDLHDKPPLLPDRPAIDSLAYDSVRDVLWFSVARMADVVPAYNGGGTAPLPVWSVARGGGGAERQAVLRFWTQPCLVNGSVGLLAHDPGTDTLWTCDNKIPGQRSPAGASLNACLHPMFQGVGDESWELEGWGMANPGTLIAFRIDRSGFPPRLMEHMDVRACKHLHEWSIPPTEYQAAPRQSDPEYVSLQLVCDAVTFRSPGDPAAVAWTRTGPRFYASSAPGMACPSNTALAYSGPTAVRAGSRFDACVTVTVPGPSAPLPRTPVRVRVAGGPAQASASDGAGRACAPFDVPADTPDGTVLPVSAEVPADAHVLASSVTASVTVGQAPAPAAPTAPPPPPPPAPPQPTPPIPFVPAPIATAAPQAGVQPAASPPGQAAAQQGMASEKEREIQLAHAQQESPGDQPEAAAEEDYAFVTGVAAVVAVSVGAAAAAVGRAWSSVPSVAPGWAAVPSRGPRRRRHKGRRQ